MKRLAKVSGSEIQLNQSLANEIGLDGSVFLLTLDLWFGTRRISKKWDEEWIYISHEEVEEWFSYWDKNKLEDVIMDLSFRDLVVARSKNNGWWFRFDGTGFDKIDSIILVDFENVIIIYNNNISHGQAELTGRSIHEGIDDPGPMQQPLVRMVKKRRPKGRPEVDIDKIHFNTAYDICYGASTVQALGLLSAPQRGRIANALNKIAEAGGDLNHLRDFEAWWKSNWRSHDKQTGQYQFPRPENISEFWFEAASTFRPEHPNPNGTERIDNLDERMRDMTLKRRNE